MVISGCQGEGIKRRGGDVLSFLVAKKSEEGREGMCCHFWLPRRAKREGRAQAMTDGC